MPLMKTHNIYCFHEWDVSRYTFFMTDTKYRTCLFWVLRKPMLPAGSIVLANWFACVPACTSAITRGSHWQAFTYKQSSIKPELILSWLLLYIKQVEVLFPIEETIVRSIITYSKLRRSVSSCLFYEPWLRYIANQSESAKETVSPKIDENIEMLVCFICVVTEDRTLIDIFNICFIYYYLFFIFSWQVKIHTYNAKDIK